MPETSLEFQGAVRGGLRSPANCYAETLQRFDSLRERISRPHPHCSRCVHFRQPVVYRQVRFLRGDVGIHTRLRQRLVEDGKTRLHGVNRWVSLSNTKRPCALHKLRSQPHPEYRTENTDTSQRIYMSHSRDSLPVR